MFQVETGLSKKTALCTDLSHRQFENVTVTACEGIGLNP